MSARERKSVWALGPGDETLDWYRRAVAKMQSRAATDPTSWRYQAFIHGLPPQVQKLPGTDGYWEECQHQTWFFLPWHRGYLAAFEAIVAKAVTELGGPEDWALPFWNYSEPLADNPNARMMPPEFIEQQISDGTRNALWAPRRLAGTGDFKLDDFAVDISALDDPQFTRGGGSASSGFGGPRTGWTHAGNDNGLLENQPHNYIHGYLGGREGWMGNPDTAALDPIFWLHHCNIDRLWEEWRTKWPDSSAPADAAWRMDVIFQMHDGEGQPFTFTSVEMIDTTQVLHGYSYAGLSLIDGQADVDILDDSAAGAGRVLMAELIGASTSGVSLDADVAQLAVILEPGLGPELLDDSAGKAGKVWLKLENVTGTGVPGNFRIYADMPGDQVDPIQVGVLSTFGIARATRADKSHGGGGFSTAIDITAVADRLGITDHSINRLNFTFVREEDPPMAMDVPLEFPKDLAELVGANRGESSARVGRVSIYHE